MYSCGALKNPRDFRDVQLAQVQAPVEVPKSFKTDIRMIPVFNQKSLGACVGHAHAVIHIYNELKENHKIPKLSPRYIYALSKRLDGIAEQGTYPRISAKIEVEKGCATDGLLPNNTDLTHEDYIKFDETNEIITDAKPFKIKGYAAVSNDKEYLKQAIVKNGLVAVTISIGNFDTVIKKGTLGLHRVVVYGYEGDRFFFRNSWGESWGDKGNGCFDWADQELQDMMVFIDLPNEVKEAIKTKYKYFSQKEVDTYKCAPELFKVLDTARGISGVPYPLTSGLRTPEQNTKAGGKSNSAHLRGLAADIACNNFNRKVILTGLFNCGTNLFIEDAVNHIHVDIDNKIHTIPQMMVDPQDS